MVILWSEFWEAWSWERVRNTVIDHWFWQWTKFKKRRIYIGFVRIWCVWIRSTRLDKRSDGVRLNRNHAGQILYIHFFDLWQRYIHPQFSFEWLFGMSGLIMKSISIQCILFDQRGNFLCPFNLNQSFSIAWAAHMIWFVLYYGHFEGPKSLFRTALTVLRSGDDRSSVIKMLSDLCHAVPFDLQSLCVHGRVLCSLIDNLWILDSPSRILRDVPLILTSEPERLFWPQSHNHFPLFHWIEQFFRDPARSSRWANSHRVFTRYSLFKVIISKARQTQHQLNDDLLISTNFRRPFRKCGH